MAYEAVNIVVRDTSPLRLPIEGVVVRLFTLSGQPLTEAQTDVNGVAAFLLPPGNSFEARFYKTRVAFRQPQQFTVLAGGPNTFQISGDLFVPPVTSDPRLSMAYGYFRDVTGAPAANVAIIFIAKFLPVWLDGAAVLTERREVRTDCHGYVQVPLIRCAKYDVTVTGYEDLLRCVAVPDAPNVNLPDLLFPIVQLITFDTPGPYTVAAGQELDVTPTVYTSDGNKLDGNGAQSGDVQWSSSDPTVLAVIPGPNKVTLRGLTAGTAELRAARIDRTIVHIPDAGIQGVPQQVTVT